MEKILVIDDDAEVLEVVSDILVQAEYEVDQAKDGREAIQRVENDFYDLVVTDLNLPQVDGMKVLEYVIDQLFLFGKPRTILFRAQALSAMATIIQLYT